MVVALGWDAGNPGDYPVVDDVSYTLFDNAYSSLQTYQQQQVNRAGLRALETLKAWGAFFEDALTDIPAPGSWVNWLHAEAVSHAGFNRADQPATELRRQAAEARQTALTTFDYVTDDNNTSGALTLKELRRYVAIHLARRDSPPSMRVIDYAAQWVLTTIWNRKNWNFRRRPVTLTIATNSTITVSGSVSLDSVNTMLWWYTDNNGLRQTIAWANADEMAAARAIWTDTGRPRFVRAHKDAGAWTYEFAPAPDIAYTVRTEAITTGPPEITDETATTPFDEYPKEFRPLILDMVLARTMVQMGMRGAEQALDEATGLVDTLGPQFEDYGSMDDRGGVTDVYADAAYIDNNEDGLL